MATSQNGGLVLQYGDPRLITSVIPGTNGAKFVGGVAGADLNTVFMYAGYRWHTEIEPINAGWNWGHNVRSIRGQESGYSNHAAGEAIDTNAPKHPLGTQTLSAKQLTTLRSIASDLIGVIRFGAFYSGRKDEMHAEKIGSSAQVSALAARIRRGELPNVPNELRDTKVSAPAPSPAPSQPSSGGWPLAPGVYFGPQQAGPSRNGTGSQIEKNYVAEFQDQLNRLGYAAGAADGIFGSKTAAAALAWQKRVGETVGPGPRNIIQSALCGSNDWYGIHELLYKVPATPEMPAAPGFPGLLKRGSKSESVKTLQRRVNEHLKVISQPAIGVDGDFGPGTERAVKMLQGIWKLSVDGQVGPNTWGKLWA